MGTGLVSRQPTHLDEADIVVDANRPHPSLLFLKGYLDGSRRAVQRCVRASGRPTQHHRLPRPLPTPDGVLDEIVGVAARLGSTPPGMETGVRVPSTARHVSPWG